MPATVAAAAAGDAAGAVLTIDLTAIVANWRELALRARPAACAAVVKADGYGLGAVPVARALHAAGCRTFFVATVDEAVTLRGGLDRAGSVQEPDIYVLGGAPPGGEALFAHNRLRPVLNSLADVDRWRACCSRHGRPLPAALHVDTGMSRLGLPRDELRVLAEEPGRLDGVALTLVMSHLSCADEPDHPMNARQRAAFAAAAAAWPRSPRSFANSSGIYLGRSYCFDLVRPGAALYGVNPVPGQPNPMRGVIRLDARILQVRQIDTPETVGYAAAYQAQGPTRIATVGVGYADGYLRSLSHRGSGLLAGYRVPLVGRVSMDLITFDVSAVPDALACPGAMIGLIGPEEPVDAVAARAGTIGYEILTSLGRRYRRLYLGGDGAAC